MPKKDKRQIILASQSKQRFKILKTLNLEFVVKPASIAEQKISASSHEVRAELIARAKAEEIITQFPEAIVIAGDTYGLYQGKALEKPVSQEEAKEMLTMLSGQEMTALTGFCYLDRKKQVDVSLTKKINAKFRPLSQELIEHYVENEPVLTWSAAFSAAYDSGIALIAELEGSLTAFTHGLPLEEAAACLKKSGVLTFIK